MVAAVCQIANSECSFGLFIVVLITPSSTGTQRDALFGISTLADSFDARGHSLMNCDAFSFNSKNSDLNYLIRYRILFDSRSTNDT